MTGGNLPMIGGNRGMTPGTWKIKPGNPGRLQGTRKSLRRNH
jgi:hypothetical protein